MSGDDWVERTTPLTVRLHVMLDNPPAATSYTRLGFAFDGECSEVPGCSRMSRHSAVHPSPQAGN